MDFVGNLGDPKQDAAALQPLVDHILDRLKADLIPALANAVENSIKGLNVTLTVTKR